MPKVRKKGGAPPKITQTSYSNRAQNDNMEHDSKI